MRVRIEQELALAKSVYLNIEHREHGGEDWFKLPHFPFPSGWRIGDIPIETAPIVFRLGPGYPTSEPYGFAAPAGINFQGATPGNPGSPVSPPFEGEWQHFSWAPDGTWAPAADPTQGSNILSWTRSFSARLGEGA